MTLLKLLMATLVLWLPLGAEPAFLIFFRSKTGVFISVQDYENHAIPQDYLNEIHKTGVQVRTVLTWQNAISINGNTQQIAAIKELPFVSEIRPLYSLKRTAPNITNPTPISLYKRSQAFATWDPAQIDPARQWLASNGFNIDASERILAIADAGFDLGVNRCFDLIDQSIIDVFDFVQGDSLLGSDNHGAQALSIISSQCEMNGVLNPAPKLLLYSTEDVSREYRGEEDYLAAAIERAALYGAEVISISLGYRYDFSDGEDIAPAALDGRTSVASLAALAAARRDILVVSSVGNDGVKDNEPTLSVPADADSIIGVGASDNSGRRCSFSSIGPTADGRPKPDLLAPGCEGPMGDGIPIAATQLQEGLVYSSGTSWSTPLVAAVALLLKSAFPQANAMTLREALLESASPSQSPANESGRGVLNALAAARWLSAKYYPELYTKPTHSAKIRYVLEESGYRFWFSDGSLIHRLEGYAISGQKVFSIKNPTPATEIFIPFDKIGTQAGFIALRLLGNKKSRDTLWWYPGF
jgi:hypothetical protein